MAWGVWSPHLRPGSLVATGAAPFCFPEAGEGWAFCRAWDVKGCREEQLSFSAPCSSTRRERSIHIFSYGAGGARPPRPRLPLHPAGEAQPRRRTESPASGAEAQTSRFARSSQAFKNQSHNWPRSSDC